MPARIVAALVCVLLSAPATVGRDQTTGWDRIVYVIEGGSIFHRKGCQTVQGQALRAMKVTELPASIDPCPVCKPLDPRYDVPADGPVVLPGQVPLSTVRSDAAKRDFMRQTEFPTGRPGYVVDHIVPLACGGLDLPRNMQWQTLAEARAKDKVERLDCSAYQGQRGTASPQTQTAPRAKPVPAQADVVVYVTRTGAKYHRAGCSSLRKSAIAMTLREAVAAGYGPCQRCRPPVLK